MDMWQQLPHKLFKYCEKLFMFHFYERIVNENKTFFIDVTLTHLYHNTFILEIPRMS